MNKKQAATFLNVSEKTVERAVKSNQLAAIYVKGKHGQTPVFEQSELERYKAERDSILHQPMIVPEQTALEQVTKLPPTTKDTADDSRQIDVVGFADALVDALSRHSQAVKLTEKLTLSIDDAAAVSGLSKSRLRLAVKSGNLRTVPGARGAKHVRRRDLDAFIKGL